MFHLLRIIVSALYLYWFYFQLHVAGPKTESWRTGLLVTELILLGIPVGCLWVPVIAGKITDFLFGNVFGQIGPLSDCERNYTRLQLYHQRGCRRRALVYGIFLYFLADRKVCLPLVIALKNAKAKSWLEKRLALQLFRFEHLEYCVFAYDILKKNHGYSEAEHFSPEIARALSFLNKTASPAPPLVGLVRHSRKKLKRNKNIKIGVAERKEPDRNSG